MEITDFFSTSTTVGLLLMCEVMMAAVGYSEVRSGCVAVLLMLERRLNFLWLFLGAHLASAVKGVP